jgi:hypothetical protein
MVDRFLMVAVFVLGCIVLVSLIDEINSGLINWEPEIEPSGRRNRRHDQLL